MDWVAGVGSGAVAAEPKNYIDFHMLSIRLVDFVENEMVVVEVVMNIESSFRSHKTVVDAEGS